jgi:hypothetical protein
MLLRRRRRDHPLPSPSSGSVRGPRSWSGIVTLSVPSSPGAITPAACGSRASGRPRPSDSASTSGRCSGGSGPGDGLPTPGMICVRARCSQSPTIARWTRRSGSSWRGAGWSSTLSRRPRQRAGRGRNADTSPRLFLGLDPWTGRWIGPWTGHATTRPTDKMLTRHESRR